jgi:hypothetical protein
MTARKKPRLRRAIERALLARDRIEIAAAERLLSALRLEGRRKKTRTARPVRRRGR